MSHAKDNDPLTPEEEALMQAQIEAAIAPYKDITPPHLLAVMRRETEEKMRAHPAVRTLLAAARRRPAPEISAEVSKVEGDARDERQKKEGA